MSSRALHQRRDTRRGSHLDRHQAKSTRIWGAHPLGQQVDVGCCLYHSKGIRAKPNDSESSSTTQIRKSGKMLQRRQDCTHSIAHTQLQGIGRFKASGKPCTFERGVHGGWRKILQESRVPVPKCQTNRTCAGVLCGTAGANSSGAGMLCCMSGSTRRAPGPTTRPLPPACSAQSIAALHLALQGILNTKPHLLCSFILATHTGWGSTPH